MSTKWSSDGDLIVDAEDYKDVSSNLDVFSDFSYDHTNGMDWYFPVVLELCEDSQWLLFENNFSLNESSVSEICYILKNKILCEFQTEIFLQHPFIIQKLFNWLNENKEKELILECLMYLVEKLIKRHHECTTGLCENYEGINSNFDSSSHISIRETNSESKTYDEISRWGIAKFCVLLMPVLLKHISFNSGGAFSLFMSSMHLLSSISNSCNVKLYIELVFSDYTIKNILLNEPLSSLKFLIIAKEILKFGLPNEQFNIIICDILKQPYWIHLYPELCHQLYSKFINEELLEQQIIKKVNDAYILSSTSNLDIKQFANLFRSSLPIICFLKQFHLIDKFITNTCKYAKLTETTDIQKEYSNILLSLLSFKSVDVVLHTYLALNNTLKKIFYLKFESNKINRLINNLLSTNVLNEIICFGCNNSNQQICQSASEIIEQIIKNKNIINNNQWKYFLNNLAPIFPVLYCYANQTSTLGQVVLDFFDPDQAEKLNISKLVLLHSTVAMMFSKDKKSRVEANNRITWIFKTSLNKNIKLPNDIFLMEIDEVNDQVDKPIGEYNKKDLDDMIDLLSNECSSHQTIKCALYKMSVILEHNHLRQHFIHSGGMDIILNLLKSSKVFVNEHGLLIVLLKLILCFTKEKKYIINDHNSLANNIEIQLLLISVLSDFHEVPLVKQYVFQIFFYCIFNQYLTYFEEIPKLVINKINTPIKFNKSCYTTNIPDDTMLFSEIKKNNNCMEVLMLTWNLKHYDGIDVFLENGLIANAQNHEFNNVFHRFRKACINWSVKKCLVDLIAAKSHQVALVNLSDLRRYLEISVYIEQFEVNEELFENALKKFLILPPIFLTDLQTLIVVLKLLHFALTKRVLINKLNWVPEILTKSESMHYNMADDFKNDEKSKQLCIQFFIELYEVYWLCLKNYSHFSTLNLTKLLFDRLASTKKEIVFLQGNMKCLTLLTENPKNIDKDLVKTYLSQFISLKTILMNNNSNEKSLQRSYLTVLNHMLHCTILVPNISEVWCMYDWETWTWSMIHSTDLLVRALVFQFSAGLTVIDIPVSHNLIRLALNYFCESNCLENCVVAEQATLFCSNLFCFPKFKSLCHQCIIKLDFDAFIQIINLCSYYDYTKPEKQNFLTSPKLVSNICCMFFNMFTLTEVNLYELDQHSKFVQALFLCLKKYLTPMSIEKPNILEMCGRICSVLTLFIPVSNYNFENLLNSLNVIYERINIDLDHCTTMVWRSLFRLTTIVIQCTNYKTFILTNNLITALLTSVTSEYKDLCIEALHVISLVCPQLSKKFANRVCNILIHTLLLEWHHKLKRKMLLITLSNIFIEHPFTYETARQENVLSFIISKLKIMQLQVTKQSNQKSKVLQNEYLEILKFCCNLFYGCNDAREDAFTELPDLIHKLWPIVIANPKSDILLCTLQMLVSLTSACPSACSAMTMTSSTLGMEPKTKCTSFSLFHEIITLSANYHLNEDILNITLLLVINGCQAQECRVIITKSKLLSNIVLALNFKDKKYPIKIEQQYLKFLLVFTSFYEGQIHLLKVDYVLDTLVYLLKSNYINDSLAILRNLCFNGQNRSLILSSDVFLQGIKTLLETGNPTNQNYKDISLAIWSIACNNQKARLQLRHWGIDRYFDKSSDLLICSDEIRNIINCTYQILKS